MVKRPQSELSSLVNGGVVSKPYRRSIGTKSVGRVKKKESFAIRYRQLRVTDEMDDLKNQSKCGSMIHALKALADLVSTRFVVRSRRERFLTMARILVAPDKENRSALYYAALCGNLALVKIYLSFVVLARAAVRRTKDDDGARHTVESWFQQLGYIQMFGPKELQTCVCNALTKEIQEVFQTHKYSLSDLESVLLPTSWGKYVIRSSKEARNKKLTKPKKPSLNMGDYREDTLVLYPLNRPQKRETREALRQTSREASYEFCSGVVSSPLATVVVSVDHVDESISSSAHVDESMLPTLIVTDDDSLVATDEIWLEDNFVAGQTESDETECDDDSGEDNYGCYDDDDDDDHSFVEVSWEGDAAIEDGWIFMDDDDDDAMSLESLYTEEEEDKYEEQPRSMVLSYRDALVQHPLVVDDRVSSPASSPAVSSPKPTLVSLRRPSCPGMTRRGKTSRDRHYYMGDEHYLGDDGLFDLEFIRNGVKGSRGGKPGLMFKGNQKTIKRRQGAKRGSSGKHPTTVYY